jgi:hypothetical protein
VAATQCATTKLVVHAAILFVLLQGCNTFTISPAVAQQLFDVQLTQDAADVFQRHATEMADS